MSYIVGFNRDRDSYEVPRALAERGLLEKLVTDYYAPVGRQGIPQLSHRQHPDIPRDRVRTVPYALILQLGHRALQQAHIRTPFPSTGIDSAIGNAIYAEARKADADLFVYSGYAAKSFRELSDRRRVLFQFHPGRSIVESALRDDDLAGYRSWLPEPEVKSPAKQRIYAVETQNADRIVCASSLTARGLEFDGIPSADIRVVPYGCEVAAPDAEDWPRECNFLYVGQGVQRKGLHLLFQAWRDAKLRNSTLRVVASRMDPVIRELGEGLPGVTISGAVPETELHRLMNRADTLVLPSLVEGFGLVLGEALGRGCRLIASTNTGIVDMGLPESVATIVEAGRLSSLVEALTKSEGTYQRERPYSEVALANARRLSWSNFRKEIADALV